MSEDFNLHLDDSAKRHSEQVFEGPTHDHGPSSGHESAPNYPTTLLGDSRLGGRGNAPVRTAVMQRMQQTVGNRAVQRFLLQRAAADTAEAGPQEDIGDRIRSRAGGGSSIDPGTRGQLEEGMGADLSGVRVHTDGEADSMARSVDAVAFTTGNDIFFRSGTYNPESSDGMRLLAHEATHTVQQAQGPVSGTPTAGGVSISDPSDSFEQAAESNAAKVVSRMAAGGSGGSVEGAVQRQEQGDGTAVQRAEEEDEEPPAQTMRASTYSATVQRAAEGAEEEEEEPAQTMRASTYSSMAVQRAAEGAEEEEEEPPAQAMRPSTYASTAVQRAAEGAEEEEEEPAQTMRASTYAVQRESEGAEEEEEQPPAQTMRASTYATTVQRAAEGAEEEEEEPAQTLRASTYAVQRHAGHEEEVNG